MAGIGTTKLLCVLENVIKGKINIYLLTIFHLHLFVSLAVPHTLPAPVAADISGHQVTIDYSKWLEEVRHTTYFIRVVLKKRIVSDKLDAGEEAPFEIEDELSKFFTSRTVRGLEGRTSYEFITEAVLLSEHGGEVFGHRSGILRVQTPCSGKYTCILLLLWSMHPVFSL